MRVIDRRAEGSLIGARWSITVRNILELVNQSALLIKSNLYISFILKLNNTVLLNRSNLSFQIFIKRDSCYLYINSFMQNFLVEPPRDKTNIVACVPSEDSDQPRHPPSLIRVFAVRMKKPWVLSYQLSAQRRLWSDWANAQTDLSLHWAHSHFVGFVMRQLLCFIDSEYKIPTPSIRIQWVVAASNGGGWGGMQPFWVCWLKSELVGSCIQATVKFLKIRTPEKFTVINLKFEQSDFTVE